MNLTPTQIQTLKAGIAANATAAAFPNTSDGNFACAAFLNGTASPTLAVWRPSVANSIILSQLVGTDVIAKVTTIGAQALLAALLTPPALDATQANVRGDFSTLFPSTTTLTNLTAISQRSATYLESFFAAGGPPATCALDALGNSIFGQLVDYQTVTLARNS